jgi:hypothetical protein
MSITLYTTQVKDKIEDGKLILYFPKSVDLKKDKIKHYKLIEWLNYWGIRVEYKKDKTLIIYPKAFSLKDVFYKREGFDILQSFNKIGGKSLTDNDFLSLCFSKYYICSGIVDRHVSICHNLEQYDKSTGSKMMYFNYVSKKYFNNPTEILYGYDLKSNKNIFKALFQNFLKEKDKKPLILKHKKEYIGTSKDNILPKGEVLNVGSLTCEGLKDNSFKSIEKFIVSTFGDYKVAYNAFSSLVFSFGPKVKDLKLDFTNKDSLLNSSGLYLTKTVIKLKELGFLYGQKEDFSSEILQFYYTKSIWHRHPKFLLDALVEHCKSIDKIYNRTEYDLIEDENVRVFLSGMLEDLELGMRILCMFVVDDYKDKN